MLGDIRQGHGVRTSGGVRMGGHPARTCWESLKERRNFGNCSSVSAGLAWTWRMHQAASTSSSVLCGSDFTPYVAVSWIRESLCGERDQDWLLLFALETYIFSKWAVGAENWEQMSFLQIDEITHLSTRQKGSLPVMTLSNSYVSWACTTRCVRASKQVNKHIMWGKELTGSKASLGVYNRLASRGELYFHGESPESLWRS